MDNRLLVSTDTLDDYVAGGGGVGLEAARQLGPRAVVDALKRSGLRGRGGAGFPTGTKWETVVSSSAGEHYVVCNAAEGEPATFKDRILMRRNPYAVLEGIAIAVETVGARQSYIGLKETFTLEIERLQGAIGEAMRAGWFTSEPELVRGPDRYLLGEETGLLAVIEERGPYPREVRPFMQGLFASSSRLNPTLVNNVETLANVGAILAQGPAWFRSVGTEGSPGTMLFTIAGDVRRCGVFERPLGTTLRGLLEEDAGGPRAGRTIKAVLPGASAAVITEDMLDLALDFDAFRRAGTGLGAGGFAVYDDSACMVEVTRQFAKFLYVESCAQCTACKLQSGAIHDIIAALHEGSLGVGDIEEVISRADRVTDGQKCALPSGTRAVVLGLIQAFAHEFAEHDGGECPRSRDLAFPKIVDHDDEAGTFLYDHKWEETSPDWSQVPVTTGAET